jgi:hypothetical protein
VPSCISDEWLDTAQAAPRFLLFLRTPIGGRILHYRHYAAYRYIDQRGFLACKLKRIG